MKFALRIPTYPQGGIKVKIWTSGCISTMYLPIKGSEDFWKVHMTTDEIIDRLLDQMRDKLSLVDVFDEDNIFVRDAAALAAAIALLRKRKDE